VYAWLRDAIISGEIEGGRFLDEQWVSGIVGVSRTPVREAFHRLAAERFISLLPRKGAQVRTVTARELEEVYQTRRLIEGHAITALCTTRTAPPEQMTELLDLMERAGEARDWLEASGLDPDLPSHHGQRRRQLRARRALRQACARGSSASRSAPSSHGRSGSR